ncbi:hypothetical protein B0H17DRAFT_1123919 [Mycena rosella]|uniref:Uncharacterized protein n=1 Tax=Mycena rosella TaxID=1033263 RepID=A0AAD7MCJ7_MYCRO|nr:hypothetical protein B0H17DRAFT_1123919 [Mycena rosella]
MRRKPSPVSYDGQGPGTVDLGGGKDDTAESHMVPVTVVSGAVQFSERSRSAGTGAGHSKLGNFGHDSGKRAGDGTSGSSDKGREKIVQMKRAQVGENKTGGQKRHGAVEAEAKAKDGQGSGGDRGQFVYHIGVATIQASDVQLLEIGRRANGSGKVGKVERRQSGNFLDGEDHEGGETQGGKVEPSAGNEEVVQRRVKASEPNVREERKAKRRSILMGNGVTKSQAKMTKAWSMYGTEIKVDGHRSGALEPKKDPLRRGMGSDAHVKPELRVGKHNSHPSRTGTAYIGTVTINGGNIQGSRWIVGSKNVESKEHGEKEQDKEEQNTQEKTYLRVGHKQMIGKDTMANNDGKPQQILWDALTKFETYNDAFEKVAAVCHEWRNTAMSNPLLANNIYLYSEMTHKEMERIIGHTRNNSGNITLHVRLGDGYSGAGGEDDDTDGIMEAITAKAGPILHRCTTIIAGATGEYNTATIMGAMQGWKVPKLQELDLNVEGWMFLEESDNSEYNRFTLFKDAKPELKIITLRSGFTLTFDGPYYTHVTILILRHFFPRHSEPDLKGLISVFQAMPVLQHLELIEAGCDTRRPQKAQKPRAKLEHLTRLIVSISEWTSTIGDVIEVLDMPNLRALELMSNKDHSLYNLTQKCTTSFQQVKVLKASIAISDYRILQSVLALMPMLQTLDTRNARSAKRYEEAEELPPYIYTEMDDEGHTAMCKIAQSCRDRRETLCPKLTQLVVDGQGIGEEEEEMMRKGIKEGGLGRDVSVTFDRCQGVVHVEHSIVIDSPRSGREAGLLRERMETLGKSKKCKRQMGMSTENSIRANGGEVPLQVFPEQPPTDLKGVNKRKRGKGAKHLPNEQHAKTAYERAEAEQGHRAEQVYGETRQTEDQIQLESEDSMKKAKPKRGQALAAEKRRERVKGVDDLRKKDVPRKPENGKGSEVDTSGGRSRGPETADCTTPRSREETSERCGTAGDKPALAGAPENDRYEQKEE